MNIRMINGMTKVLKAVVEGYDYNPGDSDLDNEQPIHVSMTLGDYRRASQMQHELMVAQPQAPAQPTFCGESIRRDDGSLYSTGEMGQ